jgi:isopropylmalate/homocitrate/citramalate synthase
MDKTKVVYILDTTLRDGQLGPRQYKGDQLVNIAIALADAGIPRIELPIAYSGVEEEKNDIMHAVKAVQSRGSIAVLHVRSDLGDIRKAAAYGARGITVYKALSEIHRNHKFKGQKLEDAEQDLLKAVGEASRLGFEYVRGTVEDGTRFFERYLYNNDEEPLGFLLSLPDKIIDAGGDIASIPDSASLLEPDGTRDMMRRIKEHTNVPISVHFHNNAGFADANSVAAARTGADELQLSYLGIADRNGIGDLATVAIQLEGYYGMDTGIKNDLNLYILYRKLDRLTGHRIPYRHIFSNDAMTIRASTHTAQTLKDPRGYFPETVLQFLPEKMLRYVFNKYTSPKLIAKIINDNSVSRDKIQEIASRVKAKSYYKNRNLSIDTVQSIIKEVAGIDVPVENFVGYVLRPKALVNVTLQYRGKDVNFEERIRQNISKMKGVDTVDTGYGLAVVGTGLGEVLPVDMIVIGDVHIEDRIRKLPDVLRTSTMLLD